MPRRDHEPVNRSPSSCRGPRCQAPASQNREQSRSAPAIGASFPRTIRRRRSARRSAPTVECRRRHRGCVRARPEGACPERRAASGSAVLVTFLWPPKRNDCPEQNRGGDQRSPGPLCCKLQRRNLAYPLCFLGVTTLPPVSQSLLPASRAPMAQRGPNLVHAGPPCQKPELSATPKFRDLSLAVAVC